MKTLAKVLLHPLATSHFKSYLIRIDFITKMKVITKISNEIMRKINTKQFHFESQEINIPSACLRKQLFNNNSIQSPN